MNTIMNKKRIIIISIAVLFLSIGILLSVIFVEKNNPHPNIVRPGNDIKLENITFSKQIKQPVDTTKKFTRILSIYNPRWIWLPNV